MQRTSGLRIDTVTYGLPMLIALVIVTRADSIRAKARALAGRLCSRWTIITVLAVMMWAQITSLQTR